MKKLIFFTALINLIFLCACTGKQSGENQSSADQTVNANVNANANSVNSPIAAYQVDETTTTAPNDGINVPGNRKLSEAPANMPIPKGAKIIESPAPYDSTVSTTMNSRNLFLETRKFKSHPLLQRVERTQENKQIKVFLKNGKAVNLPYEKNDLFLKGSPDDILVAAGVKSPAAPTPQANTGAADGKSTDARKP